MGKIRANHRPEWSIEKLLMFISEFICKKYHQNRIPLMWLIGICVLNAM